MSSLFILRSSSRYTTQSCIVKSLIIKDISLLDILLDNAVCPGTKTGRLWTIDFKSYGDDDLEIVIFFWLLEAIFGILHSIFGISDFTFRLACFLFFEFSVSIDFFDMFRKRTICFAIQFPHLILCHPNGLLSKNNIWHDCLCGWIGVGYESILLVHHYQYNKN